MDISFMFLINIARHDYSTFVQMTDSGYETFAEG